MSKSHHPFGHLWDVDPKTISPSVKNCKGSVEMRSNFLNLCAIFSECVSRHLVSASKEEVVQ